LPQYVRANELDANFGMLREFERGEDDTCDRDAVSSTGNRTCVNRVVYYATGTEIYISAG
jgi:hypothetical protein